MVCIYCGNKTQVSNSRPHDKKYGTWRRRACTACGAVFSTHETPDLSTAFVALRADGSFQPFDRDRLFASIYESCRHRDQPAADAAALTRTIIIRLLQDASKNAGSIEIARIQTISQAVLQDFDNAAYTYYRAYFS
jgi:transcriptional repressor NrdR